MVESWVEGRQLALEQRQEAAEAGENLKTPVKRRKDNLCEEYFETPQAGFSSELGLEVLTDQNLEVLTDQELEVLTECDQEHEVLIDLGLSNRKEEGGLSGIGDEGGICDLGEGGLEVVKDLGEGRLEEVQDLGKRGQEGLKNLGEEGLEGLKVATEDLNRTQDTGKNVLLGEGEGPRSDVVELCTILDGGGDGGEIEMFHISELEDDLRCLGEAGDEDGQVEIVMQKEPEAKERAAFEVEPNAGKENVMWHARDKSAKRKYEKRTVTKREFFLRLKK